MNIRSCWSLTLSTFLLVGLSSLNWSCSGKPIDENDPKAQFDDAEADIKSEHFQIAIDKLRTIKNKFPYSNFSPLAQLRIADVQFLQENYAEAALTYESFRDLHPKHDRAAYAMYRIGLSYQNDRPTEIARDQTPAQKAADAYRDFLKRFPNDPLSKEASEGLKQMREALAEKELYIADFYRRDDQFLQAKLRYQKILDLYLDTKIAKVAQDKLDQLPKKQ